MRIAFTLQARNQLYLTLLSPELCGAQSRAHWHRVAEETDRAAYHSAQGFSPRPIRSLMSDRKAGGPNANQS
jgi:hypothetical protein